MHKLLITTGILVLISGASQAIAMENLTKENDSSNLASEYWTAERMKNAKTLPLPKANPQVVKEIPSDELKNQYSNDEPLFSNGAPPEAENAANPTQLFTPRKISSEEHLDQPSLTDRGSSKQEFSSSRLIPLSADLSYPYSAVGKLFFTVPGEGDFVCSAAVLRPRIIVTAGHCVHSGSKGSRGFYSNWLFVPAYRDGSAPFQRWNWKYVSVTPTWSGGGGDVPNAADYGMLELEDRTINDVTKKIGSVTGYLGYQTQSLMPNHAHLLGYPCNLDDCEKMHQVTAQSARTVSPNNVEYGSDMGGGSSGGPWVQNFGEFASGQSGGQNAGLNRIIGITSYGYDNSNKKAQGSSIPDKRFTTLLNTMCAHKAGNC